MQVESTSSDHIFEILQKLSAIPGPTGQEHAVREFLRNKWMHKTTEWLEDSIGNVVCHVGGTGPKLIILAHMDEIGFVVRHITSSGFLFLDTSQGSRHVSPEKRFMIGQQAQVIGRNGIVTEGVFAAPSGHVLSKDQLSSHEIDFNDFYLDIGAHSREEVEALGVFIGAGVIWSAPLRRYNQRICGKAMDDRMPLGIMDMLIETLDKDALKYELWFGATVQEENGLHGGRSLSLLKDWDLAIAIDVGLTGDTPLVSEQEYSQALGKGPIIVHKDSRIHYNKEILWRLVDVAQENNILFQHGVFSNYGSDAVAFIDNGVPSMLIGVPTRYTHTAFEMIDPVDLLFTVELLTRFVTT